MLAMIAGLHSPRRKAQVNAMDQVFGTYRVAYVPSGGTFSSGTCCPGLASWMSATGLV